MLNRIQYLLIGLTAGFIAGHTLGGGLLISRGAAERRALRQELESMRMEHEKRGDVVEHLKGRLEEHQEQNDELEVQQIVKDHALKNALHHGEIAREVHSEASDEHYTHNNDIKMSTDEDSNSAYEEPKLEPYNVVGHELPLRRAQDNSIIVIPCNLGYISFALNLVCSLRKLEITNYVLLAMDKEVLKQLQERGLPVYSDPDLPFVTEKTAEWAESNFHSLVCTKLVPVTNLLKKGLNVLLTDADITWRKNPFSYVRSDLSLTFSIGSCHKSLPDNADLSKDRIAKLNTGFYYAHSTPAVISLFERAYKICKKGSLTGDQPAINTAIHQDIQSGNRKYTYGFFSGCLFANGCVYFKHLCEEEDPVIVHANFLVGRKKKIRSLIKHGLWDLTCHSDVDQYSLPPKEEKKDDQKDKKKKGRHN